MGPCEIVGPFGPLAQSGLVGSYTFFSFTCLVYEKNYIARTSGEAERKYESYKIYEQAMCFTSDRRMAFVPAITTDDE
jgi:hypothetical protein